MMRNVIRKAKKKENPKARTKILTLRLNENEKAMLEAKAKSKYLGNVSAYIREIFFGKEHEKLMKKIEKSIELIENGEYEEAITILERIKNQ